MIGVFDIINARQLFWYNQILMNSIDALDIIK